MIGGVLAGGTANGLTGTTGSGLVAGGVVDGGAVDDGAAGSVVDVEGATLWAPSRSADRSRWPGRSRVPP